MRNVVVTGCPRADPADVGVLATTGGVRDVAELHAMNFPVFCAAVSAQGTAKESASRDAFGRGELALDRYGLRAVLSGLGVEYIGYREYQESGR